MNKRLTEIQEFIIKVASEKKYSLLEPSEVGDDLDIVMEGINMLVQELERLSNLKIEAETNLRVRAEQNLEQQTKYASHVSHEIRTPLVGMMGLIESMQERADLTVSIEKELLQLYSICEHLGDVINNVLDLSVVRANKIRLNEEPVAISKLMEEVVSMYQGKAALMGSKIETSIVKEVPELLLLDKVKLMQILSNLVSNAVKFTKEGKIKILVNSIGNDVSNINLRIDVIDSGIGIPSSKINAVFDSFESSNAEGLNNHGTGLGLSICKELVNAMGGDIGVKSKEQVGTTFWINLHTKSIKQEISDSTEKAFSPLNIKVLVIEDDELVVVFLTNVLRKMSCHYDIVNSEEKLHAVFEENKYDLILSDFYLKESNGCALLTNLQKTCDTLPPVICLSGIPKEELKKKDSTSIFKAHLVKPYKEEDLYATMHSMTGRSN